MLNIIKNYYYSILFRRKTSVSKYFNNFNYLKSNIHTTTLLNKFIPDKSRLPQLNEEDLEEQFIQGSGPGGQNVNRLQNCVILRHIPTGIIVKCHQERLLQHNRKLARKLLLERLDIHLNGADSISEQKKRYIQSKLEQRDQKLSELRTRKSRYQKSYQQSRQNQESDPLKSIEQQ